MVRVSNALIGTLNVLSAIVSLFLVGISLYYQIHGGSMCQKFIQTPLLITGVTLFVVSIIGLMGSCGKMNFFLYLYLIVMFLCILGLIGFTVFAFIVTNARAGTALSGRGFKEYRLGDYSNWLHFQSGCCKPPVECGFDFKNATYWTVPKSGPAVANSDCKTWSNQQNTLCYYCDSCKAGFLGNIKQHWRALLIINACLIGFMIIIYSVGCCASRNNKNDRKYSRFRGYT